MKKLFNNKIFGFLVMAVCIIAIVIVFISALSPNDTQDKISLNSESSRTPVSLEKNRKSISTLSPALRTASVLNSTPMSAPTLTPTPAPTQEPVIIPTPSPTLEPISTPEVIIAVENITTTVYITKTGEKYHSSGCQYLSKSCIPIDLDKAKSQGYTPCSRCHPPS